MKNLVESTKPLKVTHSYYKQYNFLVGAHTLGTMLVSRDSRQVANGYRKP